MSHRSRSIGAAHNFLADELGPVYSLLTPGQDLIVVSGGDVVEECLDETRFEKNNSPVLVTMREVVGDAIFTSWTREPAWKKAHNILLPAFAPQAIKGYTEKMAVLLDLVFADGISGSMQYHGRRSSGPSSQRRWDLFRNLVKLPGSHPARCNGSWIH